MPKQNTLESLKNRLKKENYLTCNELIKNREFIFLDKEEIKVMRCGDIIADFKIEHFRNSIFEPVQRVYENFSHLI